MKHSYALILLTIVTNGQAQPTINLADMQPVVGSTYEYSSGTYSGPGTPGANQTWNFASSGASDASDFTYVTPASTPAYADYPGATHCWNSDDLVYNYNIYNASGIYDLGTSITGFGGSNFTNSLQVMEFPAIFNGTWTDSYSGTVGLGGTGSINGTLTSTFTGWGTLITPAGSYANCLRLTSQRNETLVVNGVTSTAVVTLTHWIKAGYANPLAEVYEGSTTTNGSTTTTNDFRFISSTSIGMDEAIADNTGIRLWPCPASGPVHFAVDASPDLYTLRLFNAAGERVSEQVLNPGELTGTIDVGDLPSGLYSVLLSGRSGTSVRDRVVIVR